MCSIVKTCCNLVSFGTCDTIQLLNVFLRLFYECSQSKSYTWLFGIKLQPSRLQSLSDLQQLFLSMSITFEHRTLKIKRSDFAEELIFKHCLIQHAPPKLA